MHHCCSRKHVPDFICVYVFFTYFSQEPTFLIFLLVIVLLYGGCGSFGYYQCCDLTDVFLLYIQSPPHASQPGVILSKDQIIHLLGKMLITFC